MIVELIVVCLVIAIVIAFLFVETFNTLRFRLFMIFLLFMLTIVGYFIIENIRSQPLQYLPNEGQIVAIEKANDFAYVWMYANDKSYPQTFIYNFEDSTEIDGAKRSLSEGQIVRFFNRNQQRFVSTDPRVNKQ